MLKLVGIGKVPVPVRAAFCRLDVSGRCLRILHLAKKIPASDGFIFHMRDFSGGGPISPPSVCLVQLQSISLDCTNRKPGNRLPAERQAESWFFNIKSARQDSINAQQSREHL